MLDKNTPHVNYLSPKYFEPRKSVKSILLGEDKVLKLVLGFVIANIEKYDEEIHYEYGNLLNCHHFTLNDVFSRDRWFSDKNEEIELKIINQVLQICKAAADNDMEAYNAFYNNMLYGDETKQTVYALAILLFEIIRPHEESDLISNEKNYNEDIYVYFNGEYIDEDIKKFVSDSYFIVRGCYNNVQPQNEEPEEDSAKEVRTGGLCLKVLVKMYNKLWSRLGMADSSNADKARFLSMSSGYSYNAIYNRLNENFDLTERDHKEDVDLANEFLLKMGVKTPIGTKVKSKKK